MDSQYLITYVCRVLELTYVHAAFIYKYTSWHIYIRSMNVCICSYVIRHVCIVCMHVMIYVLYMNVTLLQITNIR